MLNLAAQCSLQVKLPRVSLVNGSASSTPELLLEIRQLGNALRVSAFDPLRLDEVVLQAPVGTPIETLRRICAQKLARRRRQSGTAHPP